MTEKETPIVTALTQIGSELKRLNDFAAAYLKAAATPITISLDSEALTAAGLSNLTKAQQE